jgi:hypothetical protein
MSNSILSQEEIKTLFSTLLREKGKVYRKTKEVLARPAKAGERIVSITADGTETQNTADAGDFVIQNQTEAKELYIIGGEKFKDRYVFERETTSEYSVYQSTGKVMGLELTSELLKGLKLPETFLFIAPWQEQTVAKKGDLLVCPLDFSEVYRIARKEFFETYQVE